MALVPVPETESNNTKSILLRYCENMLADVQAKKETFSDESQSQVLLSAYEENCKADIFKISNDKISEQQAERYLQSICKMVLDITYIDECEVLDEETINNTTWPTVKNIIEQMDSVEKLVSDTLPSKNVKSALGEDLLECIRWRKGALLYMYCHMAKDQKDTTGEEEPTQFKKYLEDGVAYFVSMMCTRSTPYWLSGKDPQTNEEADNEMKLVNEGIWSDNHLLGLMYCGEMCYWHAQHIMEESVVVKGVAHLTLEQTSAGVSSSASDKIESVDVLEKVKAEEHLSLASPSVDDGSVGVQGHRDVVHIGKICLEKYMAVTSWPMFADTWNTDRAEELLDYLNKL